MKSLQYNRVSFTEVREGPAIQSGIVYGTCEKGGRYLNSRIMFVRLMIKRECWSAINVNVSGMETCGEEERGRYFDDLN